MIRKNRFCIVQRGANERAQASVRYLSWLISTIMKIPVEIYHESNLPSINLDNEILPYCGIILAPSGGEKEIEPDLDEWIFKVGGFIHLLAFHDSVCIESVAKLLSLDPAENVTRSISDIDFHDGMITSHILMQGENLSFLHDHDQFQTVRVSGNNIDIIGTVDEKPFIVRNSQGYFVGQLGIASPREDRFLEKERPIYYIKVLYDILMNWPTGLIRARLESLPVGFRIDDPPGTTITVRTRKRMMQEEHYQQIIDALSATDSKATVAIVPAFRNSKHNDIPWWKGGYDEQIRILNVLKEGVKRGCLEIATHGLTHLSHSYSPSNLIIDTLKLLRGMTAYQRELYNQLRQEPVLKSDQYHIFETSKRLLEEFFDKSVLVAVPPTHVFDDTTEEVLQELEIPYLSADMCFYRYVTNPTFRKNPSLLGEKSQVSGVTYVSATLLGPEGTFDHTINLFHELGIPIIWARHIYPGEWMTAADISKITKKLDVFPDIQYLHLGEIAKMLDTYSNVEIDGFVSDKGAKCTLKSPMRVKLEYLKDGKELSRLCMSGISYQEFGVQRNDF